MTYNPTCPSSALPTKAWYEALRSASFTSADCTNSNQMADPFGYFPLRKAISDYLRRTREINAIPERFILFSRALQPLNFIAKFFLSEGDKVIVENPGFTFAGQTFASHGAILEPIDIDDEGIRIEQVKEICEQNKLMYLSPTRQNPTGVSLSAERRSELIQLTNWQINGQSSFIVEDDTDCEYDYEATNLPALISSDTKNGVIYYNNFWKTLNPLVELGYLIIPENLIETASQSFLHIKANEGTAPSIVEQKALCHLIEEGHLEENIEHNKPIFYQAYKNLREAFLDQFGTKVEFSLRPSGMHSVVTFKTTKNSDEIIAAAHRAALPLLPTTDYYYEHRQTRQFLIPFAELLELNSRDLIHTFFTELHK